MPAEARRRQILDAARACFADKGYHASTMDDLVRASGLSKGSLYWHFSSKEDVFLALFDAFNDELYSDWDDIAEADVDKLAVLRRECATAIARFANNREFLMTWAEFLAHPLGRERMSQAYVLARAQFAAIVRSGLENGSLRSNLSAEGIATTFVATLEGLFLQWLVDPAFDLETQATLACDLLLEGLRP